MPAKKAAKKVVKKAAVKKPAKKDSNTVATKVAKKAVKKAAKKAPAKKLTALKAPPSYAKIAEAAYLNYRRRMDAGLPGDHNSDWAQAVASLS